MPKVQINSIPSLVQIMAWCQPGDKPLSEPVIVSMLTHIYGTQPEWVKQVAYATASFRENMIYLTKLFALVVSIEFSSLMPRQNAYHLKNKIFKAVSWLKYFAYSLPFYLHKFLMVSVLVCKLMALCCLNNTPETKQVISKLFHATWCY